MSHRKIQGLRVIKKHCILIYFVAIWGEECNRVVKGVHVSAILDQFSREVKPSQNMCTSVLLKPLHVRQSLWGKYFPV